MDKTVPVSDALNTLNRTIEENPMLKASAGVQSAQKSLNDEVKKNPSAFANSSQVITQLNSSITVWTNPQSNAEDIVSSSLALTSKILFASSAIPGVDIVTAPLGFVIGLIGAIVGAFGAKKSNHFFEVLDRMINDAVDRLNSELMDEQLAGAVNRMRTRYWTVNDILNQGAIRDGAPVIHDYATKDFTEAATNEIGAAFKNLELNLSYDKRDNWDNAATTFYTLSQVLSFKTMLLSQGIALFQRLDANTTDPATRTSVITDYLNNEYAADTKGQTGPYMNTPDIIHGAITQAIYRLPEDKFRLIGALMAYLNDEKGTFWPSGASQYRFSTATDQDVIRLTTWYDRTDKDPKRAFMNKYHFHQSDTSTDSHWMLWADTDNYAPQPYYRWYLQPKHDEHNKGVLKLFIFQIFPSQSDLEKYNIPDPGKNSLLIIGEPDRDDRLLRASHDNDELHHAAYKDLVKDKHTPRKCMWVLLNENE